jgi:hypothetical protein
MMEKRFIEERLRICKQCPELKKPLGMMQCGICNCFMNGKARLESSKCPIGKWPIRKGESQNEV